MKKNQLSLSATAALFGTDTIQNAIDKATKPAVRKPINFKSKTLLRDLLQVEARFLPLFWQSIGGVRHHSTKKTKKGAKHLNRKSLKNPVQLRAFQMNKVLAS